MRGRKVTDREVIWRITGRTERLEIRLSESERRIITLPGAVRKRWREVDAWMGGYAQGRVWAAYWKDLIKDWKDG